jgi:hypothetical protein
MWALALTGFEPRCFSSDRQKNLIKISNMSKQTVGQPPAQRQDLREISGLTPYARNSRTHDAAQVSAIAASIDEFGFVGAIVIRDGTIAKGHGTLAAVQHLVAAGKPIYPAPGKRAGVAPFPDGMIPVQDCSGWTDAQFRAYVIADNRLAEQAGWDRDMLALEVADLGVLDFDLALLGFDAGDLSDLMGGPDLATVIETDEPSKKIVTCPHCGMEFNSEGES